MNTWRLPTSDPGVASMLDSIREAIATATGSSLVGLYLFGSLATADFDAAVSDIDLLAVLTDSPDEQLVARLRQMHANLAHANPAWDDRIEVVYISAQALATCRTGTSTIAVIGRVSPSRSSRPGQTGSSTGTRRVRTGYGCWGQPSTR